MNIILWSCVIFNVILSVVENFQIVPLSAYKWKVRNSNNSLEVNSNLPSGIFTDLREGSILNESIYFRFNDVNYRWVANESWTYFMSFSVKENCHRGKNVELVFHGLDGIANISFNHESLGVASNTFIRYRFDVSNRLTQANFLEINFESPIQSGNRFAKAATHPVPPSCVPVSYHGECHVNFLRRMQASFGWDWGLAVPSVGIWKQVELVVYEADLIIRGLTTSTILLENQWKLIVKVNCDGPLSVTEDITGSMHVTLRVKNGVNLSSSTNVSFSASSHSRNIVSTISIFLPKESVDLWWPNGYGPQNLYNLTASFTNGKYKNQKSIMIGFRTAELVQEAVNKTDSKMGLTFYFTVNGVPIYAKGSNYIPTNILLEKSCDRKMIRYYLQSARDTNMNILRIWGGGIYECDYFYELSDQYGILIWQDMMFACSMYPVDNAFLSSVSLETDQQIWRLQHHPSIILWAGNNENEAALSGNWYGTVKEFPLFKKEYVHLYVDVVKEAVLAVDNTRYFMVSSPSNGLKSDAEGYVSPQPYDPLYGDVHYYDYFHDGWLIDHYPMTRFASEYGYQSLPSMSTLKKIATAEDLSSFDSKLLQHRQHLPLGQLYLIFLMFFHFAAPSLHDLDNIIYVSQINQAYAIKSQTEWYRKWRGRILPNGKGGTMGAMYWQLNDVWQTASWSSIEFGGKWKMLQYHAKKFFQPVIITSDLDGNGNITINIINDELQNFPYAEVLILLYRWESMKPVEQISRKIMVPKESSIVVMETNVESLIESNPKCESGLLLDGSKCFVKLILKNGNTVMHDNFLYPRSFKKVDGLQNCQAKITVKNCNSKNCLINVSTDTICLFVWLDADDIAGHFSDNGFTLTETSYEIHFYSEHAVTKEQLQKSLSVTWLDKQKLDGFAYTLNNAESIFKLIYNGSAELFSF